MKTKGNFESQTNRLPLILNCLDKSIDDDDDKELSDSFSKLRFIILF